MLALGNTITTGDRHERTEKDPWDHQLQCTDDGARAPHLAEATEMSSLHKHFSARYCKFLRAILYATRHTEVFQRYDGNNLDAIEMRYLSSCPLPPKPGYGL